MNNERPNLIINLPAMLILLLLIYIGSAFGHGGEKHDSAETTETTENVLTVDLSSELASTHDSIFATIQSGFENLSPVFKEGCYNCHTTSTEYPWYYKLPFIRSMIDDDISEAKKHMDMSQGFPFGGHGKPADDLVAIREDVVDSKMPPLSYRIMHWNAKPSESEKDSIVAWVERGLASLATIGLLPDDPDNPKANSESDVIYACPMHPDVTSNSQDNCKICGMMLEVVDPDSLSTTDTDH